MPWHDMRRLSLSDERAIYAFIKSLGTLGKPAPKYLPPGHQPTTPVITVESPGKRCAALSRTRS
jgi:hypothetical protein